MNHNQYAKETLFPSPLEERKREVENVLVMQGGRSKGIFACGVFKGLTKKKIRIDIAAGTSI
jgi:predicted acylesterase/phospholipase RssA